MNVSEELSLQNIGACGSETFKQAQELAIEGRKEAFDLYQKSALQGHPIAACMVSRYYGSGLFTTDPFGTVMWAVYADLCGYIPATGWLKLHYSCRDTPGKGEFYRYCASISETNGIAAFLAGMACYTGDGTEFDPEKAYVFFERSHSLGNPDGSTEKALCLMRGSGVRRDREAGLKLLKETAETGCVRAILKYAWCLEHGYGIEKDRKAALEIYEKVANKRIPRGMYEAGRCCLDGVGTEKDGNMAYGWFLAGQAYGSPECDFGMARCMLGGIVEDKKEEGFKLLTEASDKRCPEAVFMLGQWYSKDRWNCRTDVRKAFSHFREAADMSYLHAEAYVSQCYSNGDGTKKDPSLAFRYALRAAAHGDPESCYNAGEALLTGTGVKKDEARGFTLCSLAADDGYMKAQFTVANCYLRGKGVQKDSAKGFEIHRMLAGKGFIKSVFHVAEAYYIGDSVKQDYNEAFRLFTEGASKDNALCQYYLGECYMKGHGTKKDEDAAMKWYRKAASQGHVISKKIVEERKTQAILEDESPFTTFEKSARSGNAQSMYILGRYYEDGIGIEKDLRKAKEWYSKAKKRGNAAAKRALEALEKKE